jgi:putative DNA primase/helicase
MIAIQMNDDHRTPGTPLPLDFDPARVPTMLASQRRWVCWKWFLDGKKKWTKVPLDPATSQPGDVTDQAVWHSLDEAFAVARASDGAFGIGFVVSLGMGIVGIDLDGCIDADGVILPEAMEIVRSFDSYTEVTPSGTGLRIFVEAAKPAFAKCKRNKAFGMKCVEVYETDRYFTFTGRHWDGSPAQVQQRQEQLDGLCMTLWPPKQSRVTAQAPRMPLGDDEVVARALKAKNGDKFRSLYEAGDTSPYGGDDSAADMAMCCHLAFWTNKDAAQMDRLFRSSKLMRDKWDESRGDGTYGSMTIQNAIDETKETYSGAPGMDRRRRTDEDTRPEILVDPDEHRVSDEVIEQLKNDATIYRRGDMLVKVVVNRGGKAAIAELQKPTLRYKVARQVYLYKKGMNGPYQVHPADWLISEIHCRADWPEFRELLGIAHGPILRPDGSVFDEGGYDPITKLWLDTSDKFPAMPSEPTREDARVAVEDLAEVFADFPFENDGHRTAALAIVLTAVARSAFDGPTPLFLVDANIRGSGKTLLARAAGMIATGVDVPVTTYAEDEELRKAVTATAISADPVVLLDNLSGSIGCATLDRLLTSTEWRDRLLGRNALISLPMKTVWIATGNNVVLKADTARRTTHVRLVSPLERPEFRGGFRHADLLAWVKANRARLYMSALTILAAYRRSGETFPVSPLGSFEGWNFLVRAALLWAGCADFTASGGVEVADPKAEALERLLRSLEQVYPFGKPFIVADLAHRLSVENPVGMLAQVRTALEEMEGVPPGEEFSATQIGIVFRGVRDWVVGQRKLVTGDRTQRGVEWRVLGPREPGCDDGVDHVDANGR